MSAPVLPGPQASTSTYPRASATQRTKEIQDALKSIVLSTASTLRAKTQLARLQSSVPVSSSSAAASVNETSSSLEQLTGECQRYLSLVHGLRDYLLHAQAALEIELEAVTQREAEEAKRAAEAAAEALKRQKEAEELKAKRDAEEAERERKEEEEKAKLKPEDNTQEKKDAKADESLSGLATPPLPSNSEEGSHQAKNKDGGKDDAIVIDSDADDDEDDVPLAFAPKTNESGKPIDLTDSPALGNSSKPAADTSPVQPTDTATATAGVSAQEPTASNDPSAGGISGLDLSAFGINMSSINSLPDLSSFGIPALGSSSISIPESSSLAPATDFSELEKMMGMDLSSTASSQPSTDPTGQATDLSGLGNFNFDNTDMFGSGSGGLDLSGFDFSSLTGGGDAGASGSGGVDLSSFLTNFASNAPDSDANKESSS